MKKNSILSRNDTFFLSFKEQKKAFLEAAELKHTFDIKCSYVTSLGKLKIPAW